MNKRQSSPAHGHGQVPDVSVAFVVDTVRFLNDHEAIVTYTAQITGSLNITLRNRPGRAVVVERRVGK